MSTMYPSAFYTRHLHYMYPTHELFCHQSLYVKPYYFMRDLEEIKETARLTNLCTHRNQSSCRCVCVRVCGMLSDFTMFPVSRNTSLKTPKNWQLWPTNTQASFNTLFDSALKEIWWLNVRMPHPVDEFSDVLSW